MLQLLLTLSNRHQMGASGQVAYKVLHVPLPAIWTWGTIEDWPLARLQALADLLVQDGTMLPRLVSKESVSTSLLPHHLGAASPSVPEHPAA